MNQAPTWIKAAQLAALLGLFSLVAAKAAVCQDGEKAFDNWPSIGGTAGNSHYSALSQINRSNVHSLREVWRYDTGQSGGLETTPIVIDGVLYACTPTQQVIALDAATGKLLWKFDSDIKGTQPVRGLTYWTDGKEKRIFAGIMNFVYALNAGSGAPISSFGKNGRIDLREHLGRPPKSQSISLTSPGVIYRNLLIVGGRHPESPPSPPGDVRAYDVRTGALRWSFHTIPHPGEFGYNTWPGDAWKSAGAANNWAGMAVDRKRGIVYVPTGSAVPDFYGATRHGDNLFADTLLALDAATGKRIWHFQGVHHDLWDRDFPAPPILLQVASDGHAEPAIAQTTKQGYLFLFDRVSGKPLFPVENRSYPPSDTPGEAASRTQPYPLHPEPFALQSVSEDTLTSRTPAAHAWAVKRLREIRHEGQFVPLSVGKDTLVAPSFEGGAEWGGPAVDPASNVLYINANNYASIGALAVSKGGSPGRRTYLNRCAACHGQDRGGTAVAVPLLAIGRKLTPEQIAATIHSGKGRMPAMPVDGDELTNLLTYLATDKEAGAGKTATGSGHDRITQYTMTGYRRFVDPDGYPATAPPWGTLNALDMKTGAYLWRIPLGQYPELVAQGTADTGSENYGGPVVTAGGLLFIAATNFDHKIRAFDKTTGKLLWEWTLPFAGNATPAVYAVHGKQFVVIAAGGSGMNPRGPLGGVYVAFALPN